MIQLETYDRALLGDVIEDDTLLGASLGADDLEFDTFDGDTLFFIPPAGNEADILFLSRVMYGGSEKYLVALNLRNSNIGQVFDDLELALAYGRAFVRDEQRMLLVQGLRPTSGEVAQKLAEGLESGEIKTDTVSPEQLEDMLAKSKEIKSARLVQDAMRVAKVKARKGQ